MTSSEQKASARDRQIWIWCYIVEFFFFFFFFCICPPLPTSKEAILTSGMSDWSGLVIPRSNCSLNRCRLSPWVRKIPWRRGWQPTPVFLSGESHGQRGLAGHSSEHHKESDTAKRLSTQTAVTGLPDLLRLFAYL